MVVAVANRATRKWGKEEGEEEEEKEKEEGVRVGWEWCKIYE